MAGTPVVDSTSPQPAVDGSIDAREPMPREDGHHPGRYILAVLLLLSAVALACFFFFRNTPARNASWISLEQRALVPTLRELGMVVARNETMVFSKCSGEIIWMIEDGKFVEPGTVIVRFDATSTQDSVDLMQKDLIERQGSVRDAKREVELERRRVKLDVARLEAELLKTKLNRDEVYSHPTPEEKREAELNLRTAELRSSKAQRDHDAYAELYEAGYASLAVFKQRRLTLATKKAELAKAKVLHQLALQGSTAEEKRLADLAVAEAEKKLATGRFDAEADVTIALAELDLVQASLDNFQNDLNRNLERLENASVKAPVAGRVAFIDVYKGSRSNRSPIQVGESRSYGGDLCKIADTSALQIQTAVSEMDANRLRVGQEAKVRLPALPGQTYQARLASVALVAKDKNATLSRLALQHSGEAFVNVVTVFLDFEGLSPEEQESLRLGLTAEVMVELEEPRKVLLAPWTAIRMADDGSPQVLTRSGAQSVRLGKSDAFHVEIVEGLKEGDTICDFKLQPGIAKGGQP